MFGLIECFAQQPGIEGMIGAVMIALGVAALTVSMYGNRQWRAENALLKSELVAWKSYVKELSEQIRHVRKLRTNERADFETARGILRDRIAVLETQNKDIAAIERARVNEALNGNGNV